MPKSKLKITREDLHYLQSLPLELKIGIAKERIQEWYEHWDGKVYVAFSGGLDSTVLLHIVRSIYANVVAINVSALQYPENRRFVKQTENVIILHPEKTFSWVIERHGYPVISKRISQYIGDVQRAKGDTATKRLRMTGYKSNGEFSKMGMISNKWRFLAAAPFKISDRCCFWMKERQLEKAAKIYGRPIIGIRVQESEKRRASYLQYGCNAFNIRSPRSWPLSFWLDGDIWNYITAFNLPYSELYDMGYERSGCFPCMFGIPYEDAPNRFQRMQVTHPQLWRACEKWGIPEVLNYIGVSYAPPKQDALFEIASSGKVINQWNEEA